MMAPKRAFPTFWQPPETKAIFAPCVPFSLPDSSLS
jgi:hypothetical protein